jgi:hypothetical protein
MPEFKKFNIRWLLDGYIEIEAIDKEDAKARFEVTDDKKILETAFADFEIDEIVETTA